MNINIIFPLFLVFIIAASSGCNSPKKSENEVEITFKVLVKKAIAPDEKVYLSGSHPKLGSWNPTGLELKAGDIFLERTITLPSDSLIEFKITKGTWETEAVFPDGKVPPNFTFHAAADTTIEVTAFNWKDHLEKIVGQVTGDVKYLRNISFPGIRQRDVFVWTPPGYDEQKSRRYPVMYAHDGQNLIDPATSFLGIDWAMDETADSLIRNKIIEPFILVGINNTADRSEEYGASDLWESYARFLITDLKPKIDSLYRTLPDPANTATLGASMGGLISMRLGWERNSVFGQAACFSPAFMYNDFDYTKTVRHSIEYDKQLDLYIDNGTEGLEQRLQPGVDKLTGILKNGKHKFSIYIDEGAEHNEAAWASRVWRPLVQFYGK